MLSSFTKWCVYEFDEPNLLLTLCFGILKSLPPLLCWESGVSGLDFLEVFFVSLGTAIQLSNDAGKLRKGFELFNFHIYC
ncbi:hypothetical protein VNO77_19769 [Canavalia gladiata]|uniref:Uncharacterized protein n=1 Tax=Canavalia gladiata TaxID=3824 RepID=A0AAN9QKQ8_CANGL